MGKVGRPKSANPKDRRIEIRLTETEAQDLQYCADKLNISRTDVINKGVQWIKADIDKTE